MINKTLLFLHKQGLYAQKNLQPLPPDRRDFEFGSLFNIFGYTPKHDELIISTLSIKDQKGLSNCSFQSTTVQKEIQEGVILSAQNLTARAYYNNLCGWGGWANLRSAQDCLVKWGIGEQKGGENTHLDFGSYIKGGNLQTSDYDHRAKSYWVIKNADEYLKAIDDGFIVDLGIDWYSGYNQSGGFRHPWIIRKPIGYFGSGHAIAGKGYKMKDNLAVIQNSYSGAWGDGGNFYIDLDFLNTYIKKYGAYVTLDIEYNKKVTAQDIIEKYEGKNVRGDKDGAIYRIMAGAKAYFANDIAFLKLNNFPYSAKNAFTLVPQESIDAVPWYGGTREKSRLTGEGQGVTPWDYLRKPVNSNFTEDMDANQLTKNAVIIGEEDK
jgi:hypothetical protein